MHYDFVSDQSVWSEKSFPLNTALIQFKKKQKNNNNKKKKQMFRLSLEKSHTYVKIIFFKCIHSIKMIIEMIIRTKKKEKEKSEKNK